MQTTENNISETLWFFQGHELTGALLILYMLRPVAPGRNEYRTVNIPCYGARRFLNLISTFEEELEIGDLRVYLESLQSGETQFVQFSNRGELEAIIRTLVEAYKRSLLVALKERG